MKNVFLLLLLLNIHASEVRSQPYQADGNCANSATEYKLDGSNLCCKKCPPGERLKEECSSYSETVCEPCPEGQYIESWNYSPNCFPCKKCKFSKGLQYIQNCSAQTMSKCECKPDMYCALRGKDCSSCVRRRPCRPGYGVSTPGTADSDVKCERCPDGTFSDKVSSTDPCRPHKSCPGRVTKAGNATADTACRPEMSPKPFPPPSEVVAASTLAEISGSASAATPAGKARSVSPPPPRVFFNGSTKRPVPSQILSIPKIALITCVSALALILFIAVLLCCCKTIRRKDAGKFPPEVDANGNCEPGEKTSAAYFEETKLTSLSVTSPEQECLLDKGEAGGGGSSSSSQSRSSRSTCTLARTENGSSSESIGPLQPAMAFHDPHPEASESMTSFSTEEALPPHGSAQAQSSSLPATPKIISPVTTSPHVNVNITFHIGNGPGGTPKVAPTDLQADTWLPFGEEEEASGTLQQEAGKQFVMSVEESSG